MNTDLEGMYTGMYIGTKTVCVGTADSQDIGETPEGVKSIYEPNKYWITSKIANIAFGQTSRFECDIWQTNDPESVVKKLKSVGINSQYTPLDYWKAPMYAIYAYISGKNNSEKIRNAEKELEKITEREGWFFGKYTITIQIDDDVFADLELTENLLKWQLFRLSDHCSFWWSDEKETMKANLTFVGKINDTDSITRKREIEYMEGITESVCQPITELLKGYKYNHNYPMIVYNYISELYYINKIRLAEKTDNKEIIDRYRQKYKKHIEWRARN
jgi:hypothetical protein